MLTDTSNSAIHLYSLSLKCSLGFMLAFQSIYNISFQFCLSLVKSGCFEQNRDKRDI